jgi:hypothetical protein
MNLISGGQFKPTLPKRQRQICGCQLGFLFAVRGGRTPLHLEQTSAGVMNFYGRINYPPHSFIKSHANRIHRRRQRGRSRPMISLPRDQLKVDLHLAARWVALTDTDRIPGGWRGVETSAIPLSFGWRISMFLVPEWVIGAAWSHVD